VTEASENFEISSEAVAMLKGERADNQRCDVYDKKYLYRQCEKQMENQTGVDNDK